MRKPNPTGSMKIDYAEERVTKRSSRYRLRRRSSEVICALERFANQPLEHILDLGAADGRMLHWVKKKFPSSNCVGTEYSQELVRYGRFQFPEITLLQSDIQDLPFIDQSFDAAILTAVIEHVPKPEKALFEANRVLKTDGLLILTSPDPFWEYLATKVGHLREGQHHKVMNMEELSHLLKLNGFNILLSQKFMLSPIGIPYEMLIEKWIRKMKIEFILANQLLVAIRA